MELLSPVLCVLLSQAATPSPRPLAAPSEVPRLDSASEPSGAEAAPEPEPEAAPDPEPEAAPDPGPEAAPDPEPEPTKSSQPEPDPPRAKAAPKAKGKAEVKARIRIITGLRTQVANPVEVPPEPPAPAETTTRFDIREARVTIDGRYAKFLRAVGSFELSDFFDAPAPGRVVRDAWANIRFHPAAQIRLGHFRRPYSRLELRNVNLVPFIGYGLFNRYGVQDLRWGGRALGAFLWGIVAPRRPGIYRVQWNASVSNHVADGAPEGLDVHVRSTYDPLRWLSIGAGGVYKQVTDPLGMERQVFGAGGDVVAQGQGAYVAVEADAVQDWTFAGESPWALGIHGYAGYERAVAKDLRIRPAAGIEYVDANLSYSQSEALRIVASFNLLWKQYLRILPQVEFVIPQAPVTAFNPFVRSSVYGLWFSLQM